MFERILIATDGSETSDKAAKVGVEIARISGGRVIVAYVADTGRLSHLPDDMMLVSIRDLLLRASQDLERERYRSHGDGKRRSKRAGSVPLRQRC